MFDKASNLDELQERVQEAKNKPYKMLERFHVGDIVYPFWLHDLVVYGTVIDIDTIAHKIICDFNGISRQFCPEDLMLTNPELVRSAKRNASVEPQNDLHLKCKKCGGEIALSYDEQTAKSDFVCTECGKRISEDNLSSQTKEAMKKRVSKVVRADKIDEIHGALATIQKESAKVVSFFHDCFSLDIDGALNSEMSLRKLMKEYIGIAEVSLYNCKKQYNKKSKNK